MFREVRDRMHIKATEKYRNWMKDLGHHVSNNCIPDSPYLNIYGYPEELDYTDVRPQSDKWFRIDAFMRTGEQEFKLPKNFEKIDQNGNIQKLIYLSMGFKGCIDVQLMKRLVDILSKSPHKYIISKGLLGDKYELPDNMWGQNSVPQTRVLPFVDLVITHGGNNTVTEAFSLGKPMIVMPLFADQFDNAQRVHEKGFGLRMDPYICTEEELLGGIEKLLNDNDLKKRLDQAAKRIAQLNSLAKAAELIENLAR